MKISIVQTRPIKGDIAVNIDKHIRFIELASALKANSLFFPELSLTSYEPELAKELAMTLDDNRLKAFQKLSDSMAMAIGIGIPLKTETGIRISMAIFQPDQPRIAYSKQLLHADEFPYFEEGDQQILLTVDHKKIGPAICYESLQPEHSDKVNQLGAEIYLASVAKPKHGVNKALAHYPEVAKKYSMPVLMANCVGYCDNFLSTGCSSVWTKTGQLALQLDDQNEGIIVFDTDTEEAIKKQL